MIIRVCPQPPRKHARKLCPATWGLCQWDYEQTLLERRELEDSDPKTERTRLIPMRSRWDLRIVCFPESNDMLVEVLFATSPPHAHVSPGGAKGYAGLNAAQTLERQEWAHKVGQKRVQEQALEAGLAVANSTGKADGAGLAFGGMD